jgi:hypothetical protein
VDNYAVIDVSLQLSSDWVVDVKGKVIKEAKISSEPGALGGTPATRTICVLHCPER